MRDLDDQPRAGIKVTWRQRCLGRPLTMMCGAILPPGAKGIAVMSRGADGKEGTEDDIASWQ